MFVVKCTKMFQDIRSEICEEFKTGIMERLKHMSVCQWKIEKIKIF